MPDCNIDNANVRAFLKLLRWCENYPDDNDDTYTTMYGKGRFVDLSKHPNTPVTRWGKTSTAAGGYMFTYGTWREAVDLAIVSDFTPASQDKLAWWKIGQRHAAQDVCDGRQKLNSAISKLLSEWASLPGAKQSQIKMRDVTSRYEMYIVEFNKTGTKSNDSTSGAP